MGHGPGRLPQCAFDHSMHLGLRYRRNAGWAGLIPQQSIEALLGVTLLPAPDHRPADADPVGDLQHRQTVSREQDDLRLLDVLHGPATI